MKTFRDARGREWTIEINVSALKRVKSLAGVDLTKIVDPKSADARLLFDDIVVLGDAIAAAVQPQLESRSLTAEEFGDALHEEHVEAATRALLEGVIDFFRGRKRTMLRRVYDRTTAKMDQRREKAEAEIDRLLEDGTIDKVLDADDPSPTSGGSNSATASPESAESIPNPSPSPN